MGADTSQDVFARILGAWAQAGADQTAPRGLLGPFLENFPAADWITIRRMLAQRGGVDLLARQVWLVGPPTAGTPQMHPVATVSIEEAANGDTKVGIRLALFAQNDDGSAIHFQGWRYESAEISAPDGGDEVSGHGQPPRPFAHAQPILGWHPYTSCLEHAHASKEDAKECEESMVSDPVHSWRLLTNGQLPGFPLLGRSAAGLAVALLLSLYGAERTKSILAQGDLTELAARDAHYEELLTA